MIKWFEEKLSKLEISISELVSAKNANIVNEQVGHLNAWNGQFSQTGMWKVRRKLFPTVTEPPTAKRDSFGNLITAAKPLKDLYLRTYVHRLRTRQMKDEMLELEQLKTRLWEGRLDLSKSRKSKPWTMTQLDTVLKSLKLNQTRDPNEMINEIFRPPIIGQDLKLALLCLMNGIKDNMELPFFMQMSNITTISKPRSSNLMLMGKEVSSYYQCLEKYLTN